MFKYVRTMNGSATPPETVSIYVGTGKAIYEGGVYTTTASGQIVTDMTPGMPKYIALESKTSAEKSRDVKFLRVLPGMLFETFGHSDPNSYSVGMHGAAYNTGNGVVDSFHEEGNDLEIMAHHYDPNPELIIVTFI